MLGSGKEWMTREFAETEAKRRSKELGKDHYVYQLGANPDEFIVTGRVLVGFSPVYTIFKDGSELET